MAARLTAQKNGMTFVTGFSPLQEIVQQVRLVVFITTKELEAGNEAPVDFIAGRCGKLGAWLSIHTRWSLESGA